jgi:NAD(P)H dehydrogenase (quinone)
MNILLISAHDDTKSFVAALQNSALSVLERTENKIIVTDLYSQSFNPVASMLDFKTSSGTHANYMFEQQRAVNIGNGFSPDIEAEMQKVKDADMIIIHFPLWWGNVPAILKGWLDRVLAMGFAWDSDNRYDKGLMKGKKVLLVVSTGDPESYYGSDGMHKATVSQHIYGLTHGTLAFCGFDVLKPYVIHNVTAASRDELESRIDEYRVILDSLGSYNNYLYKH